MSLKLLQPSVQSLGQFDGLDSEVLTLKGGEVVTFASISASGSDKASRDSFDGYANPSGTASRTVVTKTLTAASRPLMLADEGINGYGTLFGSVVGGTVGQNTSGSVLGPHSATGSGKVTCWDKQGLYAVSLDACDTDATNGLQPTNVALTAGSALSYTAAGLLTTATNKVSGAPTIARFVEFATNGSLVNTPNTLVAALNSPSGPVSSVGPRTFAFAVFSFSPPIG